MSHARQQIRAAFATLLSTGTAAGANVFRYRSHPIPDDALPAIVVESGPETSEPGSLEIPYRMERSLELRAVLRVKATAELDDEIDALASDVESRVATDPTLANRVFPLVLIRSDEVQIENQDQPVARLVLVFMARYQTMSNAPDVLL